MRRGSQRREYLAWIAFAALLIAAAALILRETRGTTLWFDDWLFALGRRTGGIDSLLHPYNEHLSLVPIAIYKLLFATVGIHSYVAYRLVVVAGHLVCASLVYLYARRRLGDYLGLGAAALILFLGPGWQDILWPFQIAWLISIGTGVASLLVLERRDRVGDVAACVLLILSVASSSVGVAILVGVAIEVAVVRRTWREAWIAGIPLLLYVVWSIGYQHASIVWNNVFVAEQFAGASAAGGMSALLGLSGTTFAGDAGMSRAFGVPLIVVAIAFIAWRALRHDAWSARALTLLATLLVFWALIAVGRGEASSPYASRYLYVDCVFLLLLLVELARGIGSRLPVMVGAAVVVGVAVISNVGVMRDAGHYLRGQAPLARADLAALDIGRQVVTPGYVAGSFPGYPFIIVHAGSYYAAEHSIGTPAYSADGLVTAPAPARQVADAELTRIHRVALAASAGVSAAPGAQAPHVESASEGSATTSSSCVSFVASAAMPDGTSGQLALMLPAAGVRIVASDASATVGLRRFADGFQALGSIRAGGTATLSISGDRARAPWHVQVTSAGKVSVCAVGAGRA